ncbi:hypothetical protein PAHAL_7G197700 [Panicum hallii]|jgi:hypothetical protein|uniref:Uncharacterized protein n=1 Tax=Panicum hallii TaxID=206008 RepID=A0A2T8ICV5_9POAL|nr:hypothetical protein PAHAL_7G197700 [Panicum hallii]
MLVYQARHGHHCPDLRMALPAVELTQGLDHSEATQPKLQPDFRGSHAKHCQKKPNKIITHEDS